MNEDTKTTTTPKGNVAALLTNLKKDSLAYKLVEAASSAAPQERQMVVAAVLQDRAKARAKAFAYAKDQLD